MTSNNKIAKLKLKLPYSRLTNYFLLLNFGFPLVIYGIKLYKNTDDKVALIAILINFIPSIFFALGSITSLFEFHIPEIVAKYPKIRIPLPEYIIFWIPTIAILLISGGMSSVYESNFNHIGMLISGYLLLGTSLFALDSNSVIFLGEKTQEQYEKEREAKEKDPGLFIYSKEGFEYQEKNNSFKTKWDQIEQVIAYKTDNYAYDTIYLSIILLSSEEWHLSEDTPGWHIFTKELELNLSGINPLWNFEVISPAFETNPTLVYKKGEIFKGKTTTTN